MAKISTAILLMHGPNQKGLVAKVTEFIYKNNGDIIHLDQHNDSEPDHFYMRLEWNLDGFEIPKHLIKERLMSFLVQNIGEEWDYSFKFNDTVPKVCLFVSRYSHCFFDILSRYESGEWKIEIPLIISNHEKFRPVAERYNIPYHFLKVTKENKAEIEAQEAALIKENNIDFIILARYMQILSDDFISQFPNQIINIHHSSLPAFKGANPYKAAYDRGVKFVGATAHYVTADLDDGPIISQNMIPITHNDTVRDLKRKGKDVEKTVLANAIWSHMKHKVISHNNRTVVFD